MLGVFPLWRRLTVVQGWHPGGWVTAGQMEVPSTGLWQWTVISVGSEGAGRPLWRTRVTSGEQSWLREWVLLLSKGMGAGPQRRQGKMDPGRGARPLQPEPVGESDTRQKSNREH